MNTGPADTCILYLEVLSLRMEEHFLIIIFKDNQLFLSFARVEIQKWKSENVKCKKGDSQKKVRIVKCKIKIKNRKVAKKAVIVKRKIEA